MITRNLEYVPAVFKELKLRSYIEYYQWHPVKKKKIRFRKTYDLNRIKDPELRKEKAKIIINEINQRLQFGWPFEDLKKQVETLSINEAMKLALKIKLHSNSLATRNSYSSIIKTFLKYIDEIKIGNHLIKTFDKVKAISYLDYCFEEKKLSPITYNNYVNKLKACFYALVERGHIDKNPFKGIKKKRERAKKRRAFSDQERSIIIPRIKATDKFLYLAVVLQYYCFIRPNELCNLKKHMFDLDNSLIRIPGTISKNKQDEMVTIPDSAIRIVRLTLQGIPENFYVFGSGLTPNQEKKCSKNYMGNIHRGILKEMWLQGELARIEGLHFYSWKDTGATFLFRNKVDTNEIMRQMRHKDLSYTQRYCQSLYTLNKQIKTLENAI